MGGWRPKFSQPKGVPTRCQLIPASMYFPSAPLLSSSRQDSDRLLGFRRLSLSSTRSTVNYQACSGLSQRCAGWSSARSLPSVARVASPPPGPALRQSMPRSRHGSQSRRCLARLAPHSLPVRGLLALRMYGISSDTRGTCSQDMRLRMRRRSHVTNLRSVRFTCEQPPKVLGSSSSSPPSVALPTTHGAYQFLAHLVIRESPKPCAEQR